MTWPKASTVTRHIAVHGSLLLVFVGEPFALSAQLKQLRFGGPLTAGWGYTVVPTLIALTILWIAWTARAVRADKQPAAAQ